jgi:hypothetical protein
VLKKWGISLEFKPQPTVHRTAAGYFDPVRKKIVIAGERNIDEIMNTIRHEITHSAHFNYAGVTEMLEKMTGGKRYTQMKISCLLLRLLL